MDLQEISTDEYWSCGGIIIERRTWPIVLIILPSVASESAWRSFLDHVRNSQTFERLVDQTEHGRYAVTYDFSRLQSNNPKRRSQLAEIVEERRAYYEEHLVCTALVVPSSIARFVVTATRWLLGQDVSPTRTVATLREAVTFVNDSFKDEGIEVPTQALDLLERYASGDSVRPPV